MEAISAYRQQSFCDLSVCCTNIPILEVICEKCIKFGYKVIAVNQIIEEPDCTPKMKKRKLNEVPSNNVAKVVPEPVSLKGLQKQYEGKLQLLNRLTFCISDAEAARKVLTNSITQKYDLLAVIPTSQSAFQSASLNLNVDIISFDPEIKYNTKMRRSSYNVAVSRGLYFELMYVPTMFGSLSRQRIISTGHEYFYCGKSKNVFISSHASQPHHIRNPYDVVNAGLLLGLSEEKSKLALSGAPTKVLRRAVCRRFGKAAPILMDSLKGKRNAQDGEDDDKEEESDGDSGNDDNVEADTK